MYFIPVQFGRSINTDTYQIMPSYFLKFLHNTSNIHNTSDSLCEQSEREQSKHNKTEHVENSNINFENITSFSIASAPLQ